MHQTLSVNFPLTACAARPTTVSVAGRSASVSVSGRASPAAAAPAPGWMDRLAAWAEQRPSHYRLGRWTAL